MNGTQSLAARDHDYASMVRDSQLVVDTRGATRGIAAPNIVSRRRARSNTRYTADLRTTQHNRIPLRPVAELLLWVILIALTSSQYFDSVRTGDVLSQLLARLGFDLTPEGLARANFLVRKTAHVVAYGVLAGLAYRAFAALRARGFWCFRVATGLLSLGLVLLVAASDELHQYFFLPTRTGTFHDVVLDLCAASLVVWLMARRPSDPTAHPIVPGSSSGAPRQDPSIGTKIG